MKTLLAAWLCVMSLTIFAHARDDDAPASRSIARLSAAWRSYEAAMGELRNEVERSLAKAEAAAGKSKAGDEAYAKARAERAAWTARGTLPAARADEWTQRYAKVLDALKREYRTAISSADRAGDEALSAELEAEYAALRSSTDLAPWKSVATAAGATGTTISVSTPEMSVPLTVSPERYRLEVKFSRRSPDGRAVVELPVADGRVMPLAVAFDDRGEATVLVTVTDGRALVNSGLARPVDAEAARDGASGAVVVRATGGEFDVQSLRVKLLTDEEPPTVQRARPPERTRSAEDASDYFPVGKRFSGTVWGQAGGARAATVKVIRRAGNEVVLSVTDKYGTSHWNLVVQGNAFRVVAILAKSKDAAIRDGVTGAGTVTHDRIRWDGTWTWRKPRASGRNNAYLDVTAD